MSGVSETMRFTIAEYRATTSECHQGEVYETESDKKKTIIDEVNYQKLKQKILEHQIQEMETCTA